MNGSKGIELISQRLAKLNREVGQDVRHAIAMIEQNGGRLTHDSGHATSPTWIYTFRAHREAQLALRINKDKLSIYVRANPCGRTDFQAMLASWGEIEQCYPNLGREKPANSLLSEAHAPFLTPKWGRLLRLKVHDGQLQALLASYLNTEEWQSGQMQAATNEEFRGDLTSAAKVGRSVSPEALRRSLDRNDETGRAGERFAYLDEIARAD